MQCPPWRVYLPQFFVTSKYNAPPFSHTTPAISFQLSQPSLVPTRSSQVLRLSYSSRFNKENNVSGGSMLGTIIIRSNPGHGVSDHGILYEVLSCKQCDTQVVKCNTATCNFYFTLHTLWIGKSIESSPVRRKEKEKTLKPKDGRAQGDTRCMTSHLPHDQNSHNLRSWNTIARR